MLHESVGGHRAERVSQLLPQEVFNKRAAQPRKQVLLRQLQLPLGCHSPTDDQKSAKVADHPSEKVQDELSDHVTLETGFQNTVPFAASHRGVADIQASGIGG